MDKIRPSIQNQARRLIALEAACDPSGEKAGAVIRVCLKLQGALIKLVGHAGFRSLLSRALAMAIAEVPALAAVRVRPDGTLEGLDGLGAIDGAKSGVVVARLLDLLATFIGEPLTLGLVREAWPDVDVSESDAGIEEGS